MRSGSTIFLQLLSNLRHFSFAVNEPLEIIEYSRIFEKKSRFTRMKDLQYKTASFLEDLFKFNRDPIQTLRNKMGTY